MRTNNARQGRSICQATGACICYDDDSVWVTLEIEAGRRLRR